MNNKQCYASVKRCSSQESKNVAHKLWESSTETAVETRKPAEQVLKTDEQVAKLLQQDYYTAQQI